MKRLNRTFSISSIQAFLAGCVFSILGSAALAQVAVEEVVHSALAGDQFQIELRFNGAPPQPQVMEMTSPARLVMDFAGVSSRLASGRLDLNYPLADSMVVIESPSDGRTRMVVNLEEPTNYNTTVSGNSLLIIVGDNALNTTFSGVMADAQPAMSSSPISPADDSDVVGLDFRRGDDGEAQIVIDLATAGLIGEVDRAGNQVVLEFEDATLLDSLQARHDVTDFATLVDFIDMYEEGGDVIVETTVDGSYDYVAYQTSSQYILSVFELEQVEGAGMESAEYVGENVNMDFQNIPVRTVLYLLADLNNFNLVVSDNVTGNITLLLDDVPWDQALEMVMRRQNLDKRENGSVLYIAPAEEIATFELQALENQLAAESLSPLVTEYIDVNYAVASELVTLLTGEGDLGGTILSDRGTATVDERTNTLIVRDAVANLEQVRELLEELDVPVRQVLIEARIVNARTNFSESLGIRWGGAIAPQGTGDEFILSGSLESVSQQVTSGVLGGTNTIAVPGFPDALGVDLGLSGTEDSSFALGYAGNNAILQLELSALESSGGGEVIAQPRVATQDQQQAEIRSGLQIPYQSQAGGAAGGTNTEFIDAVLSLNVTPQITPDNRIIMMLNITQDSVVPGDDPGQEPAIATNEVSTRVLVNDGETIVLGGVFREEISDVLSKTPILGDLPYIGNLFKRTQHESSKTELLIFITPTILNDY